MKKHFYCLSFASIKSGITGNDLKLASIYLGFDEPAIRKADINHAKQHAEMPDDAVLLAVSYLGFMTKTEMTE